MMVLASAPGRAGIIGNPSDGYGGCLISCSIAERARVKIEDSPRLLAVRGQDQFEFRSREDFHLSGDYFDCLRATLTFLRRFDLKARIELESEIPVQAGLAGSTAQLGALVAAVLQYLGITFNKHYLAELVRSIELNFLKVQCGYQDQYMTVFGGINYIDFRGKEHYRRLSDEVLATVEALDAFVKELPFIIAHTGVSRNSGVVLKPIRDRWLEGERAVVEGYRRIAELALLGKRFLIERNWVRFGELMNENHEIQKSLGASGEENDRLIEAALVAGALGAKLAGAGGGGTIIALVEDEQSVEKALKSAGATKIMHLKPSEGLRLEKEP